jgi:hypothetical protein
VCFARAQLRNVEFDAECVPGYAFANSVFVTTVTRSFTGASGLKIGDSLSSLSDAGGSQRDMSQPIGMNT